MTPTPPPRDADSVMVATRAMDLADALDALGYTAVFNAIGDAVEWKEHHGIGISVAKFIAAIRARSAPPPPAPDALRKAQEAVAAMDAAKVAWDAANPEQYDTTFTAYAEASTEAEDTCIAYVRTLAPAALAPQRVDIPRWQTEADRMPEFAPIKHAQDEIDALRVALAAALSGGGA